MNFVIAAVVGGLMAATVSVGAVQAIKEPDQKPVQADTLFKYSDD